MSELQKGIEASYETDYSVKFYIAISKKTIVNFSMKLSIYLKYDFLSINKVFSQWSHMWKEISLIEMS